jgi:hypothetical protein
MQRRGVRWLFVAIVACLASCEGSPSVLNPRPEDPSNTGPFTPGDNSGFGTGSQTPSPTSTSIPEDPVAAPPFLDDTGGRTADAGASTDGGADAASGDSGADSDATATDAQ